MPFPTIVQSAILDGSLQSGPPGAQLIPAFVSAQAAHDAIIVFVAADTGTTCVPTSVQDTTGNVYSLVTSLPPTGTTCGAWIFACLDIAASLANTNQVQTNWGAGTLNFPETYAVQIHGAGGGFDAATEAIATGSSGTASAGPVTTSVANELMLGYCFTNSTASGAGAGWSLDTNSVTSFGAALESQTQAAAGSSVTATTPLNTSDAWVQVVLGLEPPNAPVVSNITSH